jgi:FMN reductase
MSDHAWGPVSVLAVEGSPTGGGRTRAALDSISAASADAGASVTTITLGDDGAAIEPTLRALASADAVVLASPVHRASFASPLKRLLDAIPRSQAAPPDSPLSGKAVAIAYTGASDHHFLAPDSLRGVLAGFFAAHVLPPAFYVPREGFDDDLVLREPYAEQARLQGVALVELSHALRQSPSLRALRPQT